MNKNTYETIVAVAKIWARRSSPRHLDLGVIHVGLNPDGVSCEVTLIDAEGDREPINPCTIHLTWDEVTDLTKNVRT